MENLEYLNVLRKHMERKNLTQAELAEKLGVSQGTLTHWFKGSNGIYMKNRRKIEYVCADTIKEMADMAKSEEDNAPVAPGTIRNTPELRECIKDAMMKHGLKNATELCRFIKYDSPHTIERLLSGTLNFFPDMLSAIFAALEIDENKAPVSNSERMLLDVIPYKCGAIMTRPIPVYSLAHAASGFTVVDGCIQPIEKYWEGKVTKTTPVPIDGRDWAAFDVEGNSMYPKLMDGDIVLCDKCRPPVNGKIVVVCFKEDYKYYTGSCVIKVWHRIGDKVLLTSLNPDPQSRNFEADIKDIEWAALAIERKGSL